MITFKEVQDKIFIGKHKLTNSSFKGYLDLHIICQADELSGYGLSKFVRVITFENVYDFETVKVLNLDSIKYFENGGYEYNKINFGG
jgi:hypothetical protein